MDPKTASNAGSEIRPGKSQKWMIGLSLTAIIASAVWIYHYEFGASASNILLHQTVGRVLAEETIRTLSRPAKVVLVTVNLPNTPELKVQLSAFEKEIKRAGGIVIVDTVVLDPGDNLKYRAGAGLSAKHLLKIIRKHSAVEAIVSLVGVPELSEQDLSQVKSIPRIIAETHSPEKLVNLLEKKILVSAIVPRFEFPAPGPRKPKTGQDWFERYFQVITPDTHLASSEQTP